MVFAFTFGAFGDIITAADLALRVSKALSSSRGSTYDYQYLIQELDGLAHILQVAETATRTGILERATVNNLNTEVQRCRNVVDRLRDEIRKYQKALGSGSMAKAVEASWRKIGWALFKAEDVRETRAKLATHRLNLIMLMTAYNQSRLDKLIEQDAQLGSSMDMVTTQMNELKTIDQHRPLMTLCESPQKLGTILALVAAKWPTLMRQTAKAGNYIALCEEARTRLDSDDEALWTASVAPGRTIRVSYFGYWRETGPGSALSKLLQFVVCPDCERDAGSM